ncbi:MAG: hypothetical protein INR64_01325 [Caulobacteraceae bacterium]|nr:hypothetical protein [Caulobacter sp.]
MQKLIRMLRGDRRHGGRERARRVAHLFLDDVLLGEARILDESDGGFRIAPSPAARRLPDAITLVEIETAVAHEVEVAWRGAEDMGLRILSEQRLRGYVPARYQKLKDFWEQAAVLTA